jgi:hypothetical protein
MKYNKNYIDSVEPKAEHLGDDKPKRDRIISQDEITDLKILLNTEKNFEHFLSII